MRIVYLHQYFSTPEKGGGTRSWEFARRWSAWGHDVHVVSATNDQGGPGWTDRKIDGFQLHTISLPYSNHMHASERIRAFARFAAASTLKAKELRGDVVYATSTPLTIAIPAIANSLLGGVPYVLEVRDLWPDVPIAMGYLPNPLQRRAALLLEGQAYRRARAIVAISPGMAADVRAKGVPAAKVHVVTHGCDPDIFQGVDGSSLANDFPWTMDGPVVVYTGTLGHANGVGYLLDLARETQNRDPSVRFAVIGDGKEGGELARQAQRDGTLNESVHFLGSMGKVEVARWLNVATMSMVLLRGPRILWKDAGQNKFFDAISSGTAVACNNDSWQAQVAVDRGVGIQLDPGDPALAAEQLCAALGDREWLESVPARCRTLWQGEFNRDALARQALEIVEGVTRRNSQATTLM